MNQPRSQGKRIKSALVRSRSLRNGSDLSGEIDENLAGNSNNILFSVEDENPSKLTDEHIQLLDEDQTMLSVGNALVKPANTKLDNIENVKLGNGFKLQRYAHLRRCGSLQSVSVPAVHEPDASSHSACSNSGKSAKTKDKRKKVPLNDFKLSGAPMDLPVSMTSLDSNKKLPHLEESIIDGFSIMAFNTDEDMEVRVIFNCFKN